MKKVYLLFALLCVLVLFAGCNGKETETQISEEDLKWDYRPMVYFEDKLYGETAGFFTELPDGAFKPVGQINTEGDQTEPMKHEKGYSNALPAGSKIYAADENIIYIAIVHPSKGEGFIAYEQLEKSR